MGPWPLTCQYNCYVSHEDWKNEIIRTIDPKRNSEESFTTPNETLSHPLLAVQVHLQILFSWQQLASNFVANILQNGPTFCHRNVLFSVNQGRDAAIGVDFEERGRLLFVLFKIHQTPVVLHVHFLKQDGELPSILRGIDQTAKVGYTPASGSWSIPCLRKGNSTGECRCSKRALQ